MRCYQPFTQRSLPGPSLVQHRPPPGFLFFFPLYALIEEHISPDILVLLGSFDLFLFISPPSLLPLSVPQDEDYRPTVNRQDESQIVVRLAVHASTCLHRCFSSLASPAKRTIQFSPIPFDSCYTPSASTYSPSYLDRSFSVHNFTLSAISAIRPPLLFYCTRAPISITCFGGFSSVLSDV